MGKGMQVFVRLFPTPERDWKYLQVSPNLEELSLKTSNIKGCDNYVKFHTSGVLINVSQQDLYNIISKDIFVRLFKGENIIIMANGQHNSGKSFTMTGYNNTYENRGLTLRLIDDLFEAIELYRQKLKVRIEVTFMEFSVETITDLLTEPAIHLKHIKDAKRIRVNSKEKLMKILMFGEKRRWTEHLASHCASSVVTIYLKCTSKLVSEAYDYFPRLQLVELSGTKSVSKGVRCQIKANTDIAYVSQYLASTTSSILTSPSRLVSLLSQTWNSAFIRVISHLNPAKGNRELNMSTLIFTSRLMQRPLYNASLQRSSNLLSSLDFAAKVIKRLEDELIVREMISGQGFRHNTTVSQEEMNLIYIACNNYLEGNSSIESLLSTAHPHLLIRAFKQYYMLSEKEELNGSRLSDSVGSKRSNSRRFSNSGLKKKSRIIKNLKTPVESPVRSKSTISLEGNFEKREMPDRQTIEAEFYTRHPEIKTQLDLATNNYQEALKLRDELYSEYEQLKKKAMEEQKLEEDNIWKRKVEFGECVGPDGKPVWEFIRERPAQAAALARRTELMDVLNTFNTARDIFKELKVSVAKKIQNYTDKVYGALSPNMKDLDLQPCYVDPSQQNIGHKKFADDVNKEKNLFYDLQKNKSSSTPYKVTPRFDPFKTHIDYKIII